MIRSELLSAYTNGNYRVKLYADGTKIRYTHDSEFHPVFPESIDIKITNKCDRGCLMCHEASTVNGQHADLHHPLLDSLQGGTELAIGGGNPLEHPELLPFLIRMKERGVICNLTVHQIHLLRDAELLQKLIDEKLLYGLGISVTQQENLGEITDFCHRNPHAVLHVIAGMVSAPLLEQLYDQNLNILFLGYKRMGRGAGYYSKDIETNIRYLENHITEIAKHFHIVSFDNLSIAQLDMRSKVKDFDISYMGDDGDFTMYVDLVKKEFAVSSVSERRFPAEDDIRAMFRKVQEVKTT